ncbi:hypothetical protein [Methylosinus sp. Sm6]|uniref:hypothetical protein n=1 Tax=Methylosinus sp. Sm6 TaxID=2866948 RepID=UPI001C994443|nr:hypothetical protein [Methylosinus sp. Sm6]MBY6240086.1 hypothetical protein [Methylosinus sp. Sm6]
MSAALFHSSALALVLAGSACIYGASPRQSLLRVRRRRAGVFAVALLLAAWMVWRSRLESTTAFFTTLAALMPLLIAWPCLAALRKRK